MQNGIYVEKDISILGYFHNEKVFCYKLLSIFIIHQGLSFGGIALKIEFVVIVYELINYEIFLLLGYVINLAKSQSQIQVKQQSHTRKPW